MEKGWVREERGGAKLLWSRCIELSKEFLFGSDLLDDGLNHQVTGLGRLHSISGIAYPGESLVNELLSSLQM